MILSIDLGTTHWKAALIDENGAFAAKNAINTPETVRDGHPVYDSGSLKRHLSGLVSCLGADKLRRVRLLALSGMAEAGLLADRLTLKPLTDIWPWFDTRTIPLFEALRRKAPFSDRARVTGLPDSHKYGIYKLLTLLSLSKADAKRTVWMSLVSYAASLLTGTCAEDVSEKGLGLIGRLQGAQRLVEASILLCLCALVLVHPGLRTLGLCSSLL